MKLVRTHQPRKPLLTILPGATRKRLPSIYQYRQTYRRADGDTGTCLAVWDVLGGREIYQIAVEEGVAGQHEWHCTCADATYRSRFAYYRCKHVEGLMDVVEAATVPALQPAQPMQVPQHREHPTGHDAPQQRSAHGF